MKCVVGSGHVARGEAEVIGLDFVLFFIFSLFFSRFPKFSCSDGLPRRGRSGGNANDGVELGKFSLQSWRRDTKVKANGFSTQRIFFFLSGTNGSLLDLAERILKLEIPGSETANKKEMGGNPSVVEAACWTDKFHRFFFLSNLITQRDGRGKCSMPA